ncbi:MAG: serine--tRNA ligase [Candidatus Micrarchaeia archaeon]
MLTTRWVRENLDAIRKSLEKRKSDFPLDELLKLDEETRQMVTEIQRLRTERNKGSLEIANKKKQGVQPSQEELSRLASLKEQIDKLEAELEKKKERLDKLLWSMPNILHDSVPYGKDSSDNVELRKWGTPRPDKTPSHIDILEKLGLVDLERAAKVAGARFYYLKGDMVKLSLALEHFAIDELSKKGYIPVLPPFMIKKEYYQGVTSLADFVDALYAVGESSEAKGAAEIEHVNEQLYLISTSEHAIAAMHAGEVFSKTDLPLKYVGISTCFRREAGAHGKDTKGIFRVHQFDKIEQFIFSRADDSWQYFDELVRNEEEMFQKLGIPYHVIEICTGDIGIVAAKKNDVEGWFPSQGQYRELTSASNCTDWQSMRLDIKYDEGNERKYVHTLNATGIAIERALAAIVENYYNDDGTITVPEVLVPYMGKRKIG